MTDALTELVNLWPDSRIGELMPWAYAAKPACDGINVGWLARLRSNRRHHYFPGLPTVLWWRVVVSWARAAGAEIFFPDHSNSLPPCRAHPSARRSGQGRALCAPARACPWRLRVR